jgi:Mn2+/Fe2+ NRAMP family transporter
VTKLLEIALGLVTGIGGFLEVGSLATSAQAGAQFGFALGWALALGAVCVAFLVEMGGRLAAVSRHTLPDVMRERFGIKAFLLPLVTVSLVSFLVLAAELGGVALALQLVTGVSYRWWAPAVAVAAWLVLWKGSFGLVEKGTSVLGLISLVFVVGALRLDPPLPEVIRGLLPGSAPHDPARYWFTAVSIIGASVSPYLFYFYSAGAVEEKWDEGYLGINRVIAGLGMGFGALVSLAALVAAAMVFLPRGIQIDRYEQLGLILTTPLGRWGFWLFVATLAVTCFGAAIEIALELAYLVAQGFGWNWGKNLRPREAARFSLVYTLALPLAALVMLAGVDPLKLTVFSMALTAASLPVTVIPLLAIMNDPNYLSEHTNGWVSNAAVLLISILVCLVAIVAIPLQLLGGG